jgi:DNA-directed RNA polymerase subunit L
METFVQPVSLANLLRGQLEQDSYNKFCYYTIPYNLKSIGASKCVVDVDCASFHMRGVLSDAFERVRHGK